MKFSFDQALQCSQVRRSTRVVTLNAHWTRIHIPTVAVVRTKANWPQRIVGHVFKNVRQMYSIVLAKTLRAGMRITVKMNFTSMESGSSGIFSGSYKQNGTEGEVLYKASQMEPADAREAFPCFDEPHMKARFKIMIGRPPNMTALSNMPKEETGLKLDDSGYVYDVYKNSVKMPAYLSAFFVGDYGHTKSPPAKHGVRMKTWSRKDVVHKTKFVADISSKALECLEDYTGIKYVLSKMDNVAVNKFPAGAMENWGLVISHESHLLFEEGVESPTHKGKVARTLVHEFGHQWLGNLITAKYWDQ